MQTNFEHIEELVSKFQCGKITPEELQHLLSWYDSHCDDQVTIPTASALTEDEFRQCMLDGLLSKISADQAPVTRRFPHVWLWSASAAAVLLALLWFGTGDMQQTRSNVAVATKKSVQDTIVPGGNKAILLLADGTQVALDTQQTGIVMDGTIHYADGHELDQDVDIMASKDLQLYIPKGGIYQITLTDGTQVWLNSDSRLKYPSRFAPTERIVELEGEAFFNVSNLRDKNDQRIPFIVKSKHQQIEVLGTQFNVNSYSTQPFVKTTLLEGRVSIVGPQQKTALTPGYQSQTTERGIRVKKVNPQHYIAWKEGKFNFDGKSFAETMDEIGRWYNLKIVYKSEIPNVELVGDAYRNERINLVLRLLDATDIRYKLDRPNRTLIIY